MIRRLSRQFSFWAVLLALGLLAGCTGAAQAPVALPPPIPTEAAPIGWTPAGGPPGPVTALAATGTPLTLYAATQQGVYRSVDQGGNWQALAGAGPERATALLALPGGGSTPPSLLAGASDGLWRWRENGGWSRVTLAVTSPGVTTLALGPSPTAAILYAGTSSGLYTSIDGGATWGANGPDRAIVRALAVQPADGTIDLATNTRLRHRDSSGKWADVAGPIPPGGIAPQVWALAYARARLIVATEAGVYARAGATWDRLTFSLARALAPLPDGTWLVGGDGGAIVARLTDDDAGNAQRNGPVPRVGLPPAPITSLLAAGGAFYAATEGGVYASADGVRWRDRSAGLPPTSAIQGLVARREGDAAQLFAGSRAGVFRSDDGGSTWRLAATGLPPGGVRDLVLSAGEGPVLFAATAHGVYQTTDGASTWQPTAGQLPIPDVQRLWTDPSNRNQLYAALGGAGGLVYSWNGGKGWVAPAVGLPPGASITALLIDSTDPWRPSIGVAYHRRGGLLADGGVPGVWRPAASSGPDGGEMRWQPVGTGLPLDQARDAVTALARAPDDGRLLATTRTGVWVATVDGAATTWSSIAGWPDPGVGALGGGALATYPQRSEILYAGSNGTVARRLADSAEWTLLGRPPQAGGIAALAVVPVSSTAALSDTAQVLAAVAGRGLWQYTDTGLPVVAAAPPRPVLPTDPVPPANNDYYTYFPQTGHNVGGGFRAFWQANEGLRYFGYPLTEEIQDFNFADNITRTVQYFERVRLEVHPEANGGPGTISIGTLGRDLTAGRFFNTARFFISDAGHIYFGETQHSIGGAFYPFWRDHGALTRFGFPISEELRENGLTVQYFERARLEYHPEFAGTPSEVLLGALGLEAMQRRGWK